MSDTEVPKAPTPTDEQQAAAVGAQVILNPDSAASMGAKGALPTIEQNTMMRDAGLKAMGLNPAAPTGQLTDPNVPMVPDPDPPEPRTLEQALAQISGGEQPKPEDVTEPPPDPAPPAPPPEPAPTVPGGA